MAATATPPRIPVRPAAPPSPGRFGGRLLFWLRLSALALAGGAFAFPLVLAPILRAATGEAASVAKEFLDAIHESDGDAFVPLLTPTARANAGATNPETNGGAKKMTVRGIKILLTIRPLLGGQTLALGPPVRRGDTILVPFSLSSDGAISAPVEKQPRSKTKVPTTSISDLPAGTVYLRRVDGLWRVSGLRIRTQDFDFEGREFGIPIASFYSPDPSFELLAPITAADFAAAWETDVRIDKRPAREVLKRLAGELGRPIAGDVVLGAGVLPFLESGAKIPSDQLDRPVTLNLWRVSRFQAMEEVCRQVGIHPTYASRSVRFHPGKRVRPAAFCGPFLLEIAAVNEDIPNAAGRLNLELHTMPLPPKIVALFSNVPLSVSGLQVKGPGGEDLYNPEKNIGLPSDYNSWGTRGPGSFFLKLRENLFTYAFTVPLKNLLRDIDAIAEVRCSIRAVLPREVRSVRLEPVAPGRSVAADDFRLTLRRIDPKPPTPSGLVGSVARQSRFDFHLAPVAGRRLCWQTVKAGQSPSTGWTFPAHSGDFSLFAQGAAPTTILFKVLDPGEAQVWEFRLGPIRLQRPPRRIDPVPLGGEAMVRVREALVTPSGIELTLDALEANDIDSFDLKVVYLDEKKRVLGESIRKASSDRSDYPNLVLPNPSGGSTAQAWKLLDIADRPKGTHSVSVKVNRIVFKNATTWRP